MRRRPSGWQWLVVVTMCTAGSTLLTRPYLLPAPVQRAVLESVDGASRMWLWIMREPSNVSRPAPAADYDAGIEPLGPHLVRMEAETRPEKA